MLSKRKIVNVDIDDPGLNEMLVRVVASGLCYSDLHFLERKYTPGLPSAVAAR
ncbi:MAG: hypothetical protein IT338_00645 [Thermomicrobiales bacterium]|nr:hypothetical protein [Thermomicrobiales bacterium]